MESSAMLHVSVRQLVEFVLRSGDLGATFVGMARAVEGTKAHKRIQKMQPAEYQAEVALAAIVTTPDGMLEVGGRADGVLVYDDRVVIDEIKTTLRPLEEISEEDNPLYWAQAKCYAHMYAAQNGLETIEVQLTYYQLATKELINFRRAYSAAELAAFFFDVVGRYIWWAQEAQRHLALRDASIAELAFPFAGYRTGQRELAVAVYRTIVDGRKLFAQAPTGIGKTMATLFPAVKAAGGRHIDKIFYLTAKTVTRELAEGALATLRAAGLRWRSVTLTAKDKICFVPEGSCNAEECEYACGHYDRVNEAIADMLALDEWTRPAIAQYAQKHRVCPFELSLDLALWSDCVICDYNYVFDPRVMLKRFFMEGEGRYCLLVDEAHNLPERAREMFSATLSKEPLLALRRRFKTARPRLAKAIGALNSQLLAFRKECEAAGTGALVRPEVPQELLPPLWKFLKEAEFFLLDRANGPDREALLELYFAVMTFLRVAELFDERYVCYVEKSGGDVILKLYCLDPSLLLGQTLAQVKAAVFFSATLAPLNYFTELLAGLDEDCRLQVGSPFPRQNLRVLVADRIATRYKERQASYDQVVDCIAAATEQRRGNYLAYFPSYQYMNEVFERFSARSPATAAMQQIAGMSEGERAAFLACFAADNTETLIGFAVLGGVFGEGIDLVGERLAGVIIVGVGLPQVCLERDLIRGFFAANERGFEYAYMYPGLNKVLQAAGRVIRTETDRGFILLIDDRFGAARYRRLLPSWWRPIVPVQGAEAVKRELAAFWAAGAE